MKVRILTAILFFNIFILSPTRAQPSLMDLPDDVLRHITRYGIVKKLRVVNHRLSRIASEPEYRLVKIFDPISGWRQIGEALQLKPPYPIKHVCLKDKAVNILEKVIQYQPYIISLNLNSISSDHEVNPETLIHLKNLSELKHLSITNLKPGQGEKDLSTLMDVIGRLSSLSLHFSSSLKNVNFLTHANNLKELDLNGNIELWDITGISSIVSNLECLDLSETAITHINPLKQAIRLKELRLSRLSIYRNGYQLLNIDALSSTMSCLRCLDLSVGNLKDFTLFARAMNLEVLDIGGSRAFKDLNLINPILPKLRKLVLSATGIIDFQPLQKASRLTELDISNTAITNLSPLLLIIPNLITLSIDEDQIRDIAMLKQAKYLRKLSLFGNNAIKDISTLIDLTKEGMLKEVILFRCYFIDESDIEKLRKANPALKVE